MALLRSWVSLSNMEELMSCMCRSFFATQLVPWLTNPCLFCFSLGFMEFAIGVTAVPLGSSTAKEGFDVLCKTSVRFL